MKLKLISLVLWPRGLTCCPLSGRVWGAEAGQSERDSDPGRPTGRGGHGPVRPAKAGGRPATGLTKADGGFSLTTLEDQDGALPGDYKVVITYNPPVETGPAQNTEQGMKQAAQAQAKMKKQKPKYVIPPAYTDAAKTPVPQKVPADGPVKIDIK